MLGECIRAELRAFRKMEMRHKTNMRKIRERRRIVRRISLGLSTTCKGSKAASVKCVHGVGRVGGTSTGHLADTHASYCPLFPVQERILTTGETANIGKETRRQVERVPHAHKVPCLRTIRATAHRIDWPSLAISASSRGNEVIPSAAANGQIPIRFPP